ncbi:uncharacterized protein LOC122249837 [Penaeus japonicus]|uniref:uncharacterized protein LOC122249837 n=1 Tax=Penaeus japonicus TaxID=27405 RepID=UPI001C70B012|nr:uncharacterized protein LOC122249837 [Penaeus japonicus]
MPGYHGTKVSFHPEYHMLHPRAREMLARQHAHPNPTGHPMFDALKSKHAQEKAEYMRMLKGGRRMGGDAGYPTFDSLNLLGAENDASYLDRFMSEGERRPRSGSHGHRHGGKRNSVNVDNIKKTLIGSLRSVASDENIYESMEVINYRKTVEAISRNNKVRSVPKTGHPLFDHLRVEKVLKPRRPQHHQRHSDGSNSPSSSGSGDEFEYVKKPNCRFSRREVLMGSAPQKHQQREPKQQMYPNKHIRHVIEEGSESDEDWAIPRPKFCEGARSRRTGAGLMTQLSHEESDSSSKSTGLR